VAQISRSIDLASAEELLDAVGSSAFGPALARFMDRRMNADHVTCLTYSDSEGLDCIFNTGKVQDRWAKGLMSTYVEKYFRLDPNMEKVVMPLSRESHTVIAFDPDRLPSTQYRTHFWKRSPFADKCSLIFFDHEIGFYFNVYRSSGNVSFSKKERSELNHIGRFLAGLLRAHFRLVRTHCAPEPANGVQGKDDSRGGFGGLDQLSAREKVVMDLILVGQSSEAIALDQGVTVNTVKTYRRRLYRKLNVSTLNELHAKFGRTKRESTPTQI